MLVQEFLEHSAARLPDKTALVCGERRLNYREINALANQLAFGLQARGVQRGDRVAVCLDNTVEAAVAVWGTLKAGAVLMMINPSTKLEKLASNLGDARATVLICSVEKTRQCAPALGRLTHLQCIIGVGTGEVASESDGGKVVGWTELLEKYFDCTKAPARVCINVDLASLMYTSGSTGEPKGAMMTHLNMVAIANSITLYLQNTEADVILNVLPLSFGYGLYQLLMAAKIGGTLVLERSMAYPHVVLKKMVSERVTGFALVPMIAAILLQSDMSTFNFSSLRYITNAGAAMPVEHFRKLRTQFPQTQIYSMYGQTECARVCYLHPDQIDIRPSSVGFAIPNTEAWLVDEAGNRLGNNARGELVVRGAHVMLGYWGKPEETARALRPGLLPHERVLYTGDLFRTDDEGYLYFVARRDDIIKSRGEKVSPREIENVLHALEGVVEAAVIGVPDPVLGQAVKAVVVLKNACELKSKDILRYCVAHLEDYMVPKFVEIRDALPRTSSGKVNKREL